MELLGLKVRDVVTGFEGIVTTLSFDLYGCIQVVISPETDKDGKMRDGAWFDAKRLKVLGRKPVMPVPDFVSVPGPAHKPATSSDPSRK